MGMGEAIRTFFARYTDFQGRSRRSEYWWFILAFYIFLFVVGGLMFTIGGLSGDNINVIGMALGAVLAIAVLAIFIPGLALSVRRFHDLGQSGWLVLVFAIAGAIPLVGFLASIGQLIWFAMPGTTGPNKYGPDPKGGHDVGVFS